MMLLIRSLILIFTFFGIGYTLFAAFGALVLDIPLTTTGVFFAGSSTMIFLSILARGNLNAKQANEG